MKIRKTLLLAGMLLSLAAIAGAQVTYERILNAAHEPQSWLTYSGRYSGWRYSTLDQINAQNASHLTMRWAFQVGDLGQFETTPLVSTACFMEPDRMTGRLPWMRAPAVRSGATSATFQISCNPAAAW